MDESSLVTLIDEGFGERFTCRDGTIGEHDVVIGFGVEFGGSFSDAAGCSGL